MHTKSLLPLFLIFVMAPTSMLWGQNYSLSFDGSDDYVSVLDNATLDVTNITGNKIIVQKMLLLK